MNKRKIHIYKAIWWTCKLTLDGEILTPVPGFRAYNPFDSYFPSEEIKLDRKSLPYLFLAVDAKKPEEVLEFCKRFGLLGPALRDDDAIDHLHLDYFDSISWPSEWKKGREPVPSATLETSLIENFGFNLDGFRNIPAMSIEEFRRAQDSMRAVITWADQLKLRQSEDKETDTRILLRVRVNAKVSLIRPRLDWNEQEAAWQMGWDIGSLQSVMYLMLLFDLLGPGRILSCPECRNPFLGGREWTTFCSSRCRNTFKQRAKRERKSKNKSVKVALKTSKKPAPRS